MDDKTSLVTQVIQILDDACPPGSKERERLEAAAEDARKLLIKHGYGHLLEDRPS